MTFLTRSLLLGLVCGAISQPSFAADFNQSEVKIHPSQGAVEAVEGASSTLIRGPEGVHIQLATQGLTAGHVYTYWMVVFNEPSRCEVSPCTGKDALIRTSIVESDAGFVGGSIVGADGTLAMSAYQPVGPLKNTFFNRGILSTEELEVHLILQDHGPVIAGRELEMLSTYRGGCTDSSIPPPFPQSARVQGNPGPNKCQMVQFAAHLPN